MVAHFWENFAPQEKYCAELQFFLQGTSTYLHEAIPKRWGSLVQSGQNGPLRLGLGLTLRMQGKRTLLWLLAAIFLWIWRNAPSYYIYRILIMHRISVLVCLLPHKIGALQGIGSRRSSPRAEAPFSKLSTGLTATGHWWAWYEPCQLREWEYMRLGGYRPPSCPAAEEIASFFTAGRDPIF